MRGRGGWILLGVLPLAACWTLTADLDLSNGITGPRDAAPDGPSRVPDGGDGGVAPDASASSDGSADRAPPYVREVLADGPVAYFRMDDGPVPADPNQPHLFDEVSRQRLGVRHGTVTSGVPGALGDAGGTAFRFDQGYLELGDRLGFSGNVPFTIEMWIRSTSKSFSHVVTKQYRGTPKVGYAVFTNGGSITFERYQASVGVQSTISFAADGQYRHVAVVYDAAMLNVYIDGLFAGSKPDTRSMDVANAPLLLGVSAVGADAEIFQGSLDEVAAYEKALPADRLRAHVAAATP